MGVRGDPDCPPFQLLAVEEMQLSGLVLANVDKGIDREKGRKAADGAGECPENPKLSTIVAVVSIEGVADEAAIAGFRAKQPDLPLKLHCGRRQQRNPQLHTGVADREPRREIVASVDHQVVVGQQARRVLSADALLNRRRLHEMIQAMNELKGQIGFRIAGVAFAK